MLQQSLENDKLNFFQQRLPISLDFFARIWLRRICFHEQFFRFLADKPWLSEIGMGSFDIIKFDNGVIIHITRAAASVETAEVPIVAFLNGQRIGSDQWNVSFLRDRVRFLSSRLQIFVICSQHYVFVAGYEAKERVPNDNQTAPGCFMCRVQPQVG